MQVLTAILISPSWFFLGGGERCFTLRLVPFFDQSSKDLLLLLNREIGIFKVFFSVSSLDEGDGVLGTLNLGKNHLAFLQPPSRLNGILRKRGEPEVVLVEMVKRDGLSFLDLNRNSLHPFFYRILVKTICFNEMVKVIDE